MDLLTPLAQIHYLEEDRIRDSLYLRDFLTT